MHWFKVHLELLHTALNHLSRDKGALKAFVGDQEKECSAALDRWSKTEGEDADGAVGDMISLAVTKLYTDTLVRQLPACVEFAENKLHQTEIILRCAFFEAEMKDVHRHCLYAKSTLLKADRKIDLGRVVVKGEDAVIEEEIEAEVDRIDRQGVNERAKYFRETLGLKWGDPKLFKQFYSQEMNLDHEGFVTKIETYSNLRNKIVHEDTDYVVKQDELKEARDYFTCVPTLCCLQALKLYPTHFAEK
jgi:hypothetical protein